MITSSVCSMMGNCMKYFVIRNIEIALFNSVNNVLYVHFSFSSICLLASLNNVGFTPEIACSQFSYIGI